MLLVIFYFIFHMIENAVNFSPWIKICKTFFRHNDSEVYGTSDFV